MPFPITNEVVQRLSEDLIDCIKLYRKLRDKREELEPPKMTSGLSDISIDDLLGTKKLEDYKFEIYGDDYWNDIIVAKIEVIGSIGGLELMKSVYYYLEDHPEEDEYHFSRRFDHAACAIEGWAT